MGKRKKLKPTDGLGELEIKKLRTATRLVWHRSYSRKLCVIRCTGKDGFTFCELCKKRTPKLKVDHLVEVGKMDGGYLERLFVPSKGLQGLCDPCHKIKTKAERAKNKKPKKEKFKRFD